MGIFQLIIFISQNWKQGGSGRFYFHLVCIIATFFSVFYTCEGMSANITSKPPNEFKNFKLISSLLANDLIPVHKYVSNETGLTLVISEVEGPVVNGYFCLATEAHDDDGLPHTLEHLIFLGSESYPYKGVLDLLANRCLASGTNAWTDTDHTCYTITTAGSEGFLTLLPIYLDNILFPTLTDSGFVTEVYHINGEGRDGGVVYTEMQGRENTGESRTYLELMREIYPDDCGYKYETGGIMKNLRESTTSQKCRDFHKQFYRPENLYLIIVGDVVPANVLETVAQIEEKIISKGSRGEYKRPWQEAIPSLPNSIQRTVLFPCDEEVNGMVYIGWRGPCVTTDIYGLTACSILLKYLTDTAVSPVTKDFVELDDPFASKVSYSLVENSESLLMIHFENVPMNKLDKIASRLNDLFTRMLSSSEVFDMNRLETVINRHRLECLSHLESSPHDTVAYILIGHMLYGNSSADLDQRLNIFRDLERMAKEQESFWIDILRKYFVDSKNVTIIGKPSMAEQKRMTQDEEARVKSRVEELGTAGLELKDKALNDAFQENEAPPPEDILTSVPIPSVDSIHFHSISAYNSSTEVQHPLFDTRKVPVYMQLDHLNTNFVYMIMLMDSSKVEEPLRRCLPLLLEMMLESPVQRGDTLIPYEEVVQQLERDTIAAATRIGLDTNARFQCGAFCSTVSLMLQLEPAKYEKGVDWIREILFQTKLTPERVKIVANRLINNVSEVKRKGYAMVSDLMTGIIYKKDSNHFLVGALRQQKFLTSILEQLNSGNLSIMEDLESLRNQITRPENIVVHMAANIEHLAKAVNIENGLHSTWSNLLPDNVIPIVSKLKVTPDWSLMVKEPETSAGTSCVAGVGAVESNFFTLTTPCLNDFNHPDLPALIVFLQYLTQLEGPLWKQIRGQGLAYSYNIVVRPYEGVLIFTLFKASNVVGAYKEAKFIVEDKLSSLDKWDTALFESARSSVIFEIINREKCISDVVAQSVLSYFNAVDHNYNRDLIHKIANVTIKELAIVGEKYVSSIFDPEKSKVAIVCHPSKVDEVGKAFKALGVDLTTYPSLEDSFLNSW